MNGCGGYDDDDNVVGSTDDDVSTEEEEEEEKKKRERSYRFRIAFSIARFSNRSIFILEENICASFLLLSPLPFMDDLFYER